MSELVRVRLKRRTCIALVWYEVNAVVVVDQRTADLLIEQDEAVLVNGAVMETAVLPTWERR